jgi:hypothetical protein
MWLAKMLDAFGILQIAVRGSPHFCYKNTPCLTSCGTGFQPLRSSQIATPTRISRKHALKIVPPATGI